jgi:hypothetical protein
MMACQCATCQSACETTPGWFHPDQIAPLADNLGLTEQQLFDQHLAIGHMDKAGVGPTYYLTPAAANHPAKSVNERGGGGRCHWFEDGRCKIHEMGKPAECQWSSHDRTPPEFIEFAGGILRAWESQQRMVAKFIEGSR